MPPLVATYRFQLREGIDFDAVAARIPWLVDLGISHIYLAPIATARSGSTHGYDVVDPNEVDPVLGGQQGFERLCDAAHHAGLGVILDIVPNHMAFTPQNLYLRDVLRFGRDSEFARVFDIDWHKGAILFPILDAPLGELVDTGQVTLDTSGKEACLLVYGQRFPLRERTTLPPDSVPLDIPALAKLLAEQYWRLGHWRDDADRIAHRRFFNITDLIGVRQEDPEVFELTHRWVFEQIAADRVDGLRVDHVDGLAQPGAYLERLRAHAGDIPIWAEKIVKPGEEYPDWPIEGLTGYEFVAPVTQFLTDPQGLAAIRAAATGATPESYVAEVRSVRRQLLQTVFTPELERLAATAMAALLSDPRADAAPEANDVRVAIAGLAVYWPVYRSYTADGVANETMLDESVASVRHDKEPKGALDRICRLFSLPGEHAEAFRVRFEQLTGALTAKSEEDTVFYRDTAYLPFCEVGLEPDLPALGSTEFEALMNTRARETPHALSTLSTHDSKRSADARAVLIALSHLPELATHLLAYGRGEAQKRGLPEVWGIYAIQTALIMRYADSAGPRIGTHLSKALREAKTLSTHERPDDAVENAVARLCLDLHRHLGDDYRLWSKEQAEHFEAQYEAIVLAQVALQLAAPGVPDIYQGTEILNVMLTDPDNRRAVDWAFVAEMDDRPADWLAGEKLHLSRRLIALRRSDPELFVRGEFTLEMQSSGTLQLNRQLNNRRVRIDIPCYSGFEQGRRKIRQMT